MPRLRYLPLCMALAVMFNHFHCVGTSARAAGEVARLIERVIYQHAPRDFASIPKCENETGCICRGAVFVSAPAVDLIDLTACQWQVEADAPRIATTDALFYGADFASLERRDFAGPTFGRALRAWLGSLLI